MTRLYVSAAHILVTHRDSQPYGFLLGNTPSTRSREQALAKARALQAQLERDPSRFEELATRDSDDRRTAPLGGVLGTFRAGRIPPELVDALGHLRPFAISHVVESAAGFHLLRRLPAPPATPVTVAHIVIKHRDAMGFRRMDRELSSRSREEALELARKVADEARREPARFRELVQRYSESDDVLRDGDLGELTPYDDIGADLTFFTRVSRLAVGEVSEVFESHGGFEIVQRRPSEVREVRAASLITLPYRGAQSNIAAAATRSKEKAKITANALVRELRAHPELFPERRTEYCELYHCDAAFRFKRGDEVSALDVAVGKLRLHELAVLDSPAGLLVIRREEPSSVPSVELAPLTEFPTAEEVAAAEAMQTAAPESSVQGPEVSPADLVAEFGEHAARDLALPGDKASAFSAIFTELTTRMRARAEPEYDEDVAWADAQLLALLGEDKNEEFLRYRRRYIAQHQ